MQKIQLMRRPGNFSKTSSFQLYAVFTLDRERISIRTGIEVTHEEWDKEKQIIKGRSQSAKDRNLILSNVRARITDVFVRARLSGTTLTKARFLEEYQLPGACTRFVDFARHHLKELSRAQRPETIRHHETIIAKVEAYAPGLELRQITPEWIQGFMTYMRDKLYNAPGTIRKCIGIMRAHYYAAIRAGKVTENPFESVKMPKDAPAIVFLTEDELNTLIRLYKDGTLPDNEQVALRFFLFMTFTGMHISDARSLQIEQIFGGEIHYQRLKTGTKVSVPLSKPAALLVQIYMGGRHRGKLIRDLPSDQGYNRLIKKVATKAGICKAVSAKAARHTFATLYYKKNSGDLGTLSKLLGHVSVSTTMVYAHITKDMRQEGISAFDGLM
ncbi:site-specific integrase [bacterium]|nr:site-specific integrase [bacterium]